jgi:hypothetical protein
MTRKSLKPEEVKPEEVKPEEIKPELDSATHIAKPSGFSLDKFKSKRPTIAAGVRTLLGALPHYPLVDAGDFVLLHPNEGAYWSPELCFVDVPIMGQKKDTTHLIDEELISLLPAGKKVTRHRLALATKPYDVFFLAHVPSVNLDNSWNESNLNGCQLAKTKWVQLASLKSRGEERYEIGFAEDQGAFPKPNWPKDSLEELIGATFGPNRAIESADHPGMLRLRGAKQSLK